MFNFICKSFPHFKHSLTNSSTYEHHILQLNHLLSFSSKCEKNHSFSVKYLIDKCGLSPEKAILASKYVSFNNPEKPDAVISFLKNQGFTETQVFVLVNSHPRIVLSDPENTLLPKINFYLSRGVSKADLITILARYPQNFLMNLDRKIIPTFNCLEKLLGSAEDTIRSIKNSPRLIGYFQPTVFPNIEVLRKAGVPEPNIRSLLIYWPSTMSRSPNRFKQVVDEVHKMGFDPVKTTFFKAVVAIFALSKSSWKKKIEVYKKWGCSEDEVLSVFLRNPWCMSVSDSKIDKIMDFFVNEMSWDPLRLMHSSRILSCSFKVRIIPRCSVYKILLSKGLIKEDSSLYTLLNVSEEIFRRKYVDCYEKEAPELLKLYLEKMKVSR